MGEVVRAIRTIALYMGPNSPLGDGAAFALIVTTFLLGFAFVMPVLIWMVAEVVGPWWGYWLTPRR